MRCRASSQSRLRWALIAAAAMIATGQARATDVQFVWSGAVTPTSARVKAKLVPEGAIARLMVSRDLAMGAPFFSDPDTAITAENNRVVDLAIGGLLPATQYYYLIEVNGAPDSTKQGQFRTFLSYGAGIFTFAFASCAATGSNHVVFQTIRNDHPLFFMHMGDFHYQNIGVNDVNLFRAAYETVLASVNQSALYRSQAVDYIWDDHDFGPNNSDSTAPGRVASRLTYQEYVPHYPLSAGSGDVPIYHAFSIGRVRFIVTDSRSARSPASATDDASKTMLGAPQKAWLKQELLDAQGNYPLKIWVNSLPWIGVTGDDGWYLYTNERREIADFIKGNGITGLCMISGDAHMLAIDNGTNSDYATGGGAGFPVMQAAALDQTGSVKGGPYSEGIYPGRGQFGLMTVIDSGGSQIIVQWSGRDAAGAQLVSYQFTVAASALPCDCSSHGDVAGNGPVFDILDVTAMIDCAFRGGVLPPKDLVCPHLNRGDLNCDGINDVIDVVSAINVAFRGQGSVCDPCSHP